MILDDAHKLVDVNKSFTKLDVFEKYLALLIAKNVLNSKNNNFYWNCIEDIYV